MLCDLERCGEWVIVGRIRFEKCRIESMKLPGEIRRKGLHRGNAMPHKVAGEEVEPHISLGIEEDRFEAKGGYITRSGISWGGPAT